MLDALADIGIEAEEYLLEECPQVSQEIKFNASVGAPLSVIEAKIVQRKHIAEFITEDRTLIYLKKSVQALGSPLHQPPQ